MTLTETFEKYRDDIYLILYKIVGNATGSLSNPCYNPPIASMLKASVKTSLWTEILANGDFDFNKYISTTVYKTIQPYLLLRDEMVWFLLLTSIHFHSKKKQDNIDRDIHFLSAYVLMLKYYTSLSNKHMSKFCDKTKAIMALETLSDKSLFSTKNEKVMREAKSTLNMYTINEKVKNSIRMSSIALGIVHLVNTIQETYYNRIDDVQDTKNMSKLIIVFRSRISQSFKAFAQHYYELAKTRIETDADSDTTITNVINQVMNSNAQRMTHIPENHYKIIMQVTSIPINVLTQMYDVLFRDFDNQQVVGNVVNIFLHEDRYDLLIKSESVFEWVSIIRGVIAIRSKYEIRSMLMQVLQTSDELMAIYNEKSDSFKHKMIQAIGMVIGISIYDTIKSYNVARINHLTIV